LIQRNASVAKAHGHAPASFGTAFAVGIGLNLTFVAVEFSYGVLANSVALMADAGHNLSDVLGAGHCLDCERPDQARTRALDAQPVSHHVTLEGNGTWIISPLPIRRWRGKSGPAWLARARAALHGSCASQELRFLTRP
jgi:hypothetical protein